MSITPRSMLKRRSSVGVLQAPSKELLLGVHFFLGAHGRVSHAANRRWTHGRR